MTQAFDIAVIGAGAAGLTVAVAAAGFGERVVIFERGEMGGDCLNTGCVPSKALLAAAAAAQAHRRGAGLGITPHQPSISFTKAMQHVERTIAALAPHDSQARLEGLGIAVVRAAAHFTGPAALEANGEAYAARRFVIATGSRPAVPPIPGLAETPHFTTDTVFTNRKRPQHLLVIGAGPIGLELAQAHRRLGSKVTVVDVAKPLAREDAEMAKVVTDALAAEGIALMAGVAVAGVKRNGKGIAVLLADGRKVSGSHLLVAAGRLPNIDHLGLDAAGIAFTSRGITVDAGQRSISNRRVYAAGDVAGSLQFTHVAGHQAGLVIRNLLFRLPVKFDASLMPRVTYTDPELAHVGLSEAEARQKFGDAIRILTSPFTGNDRAVADHNTQGLVKIVAKPDGRILGVSVVGRNAGDQIAMWALAVQTRQKLSRIAGLVLPYPTRAEAGRKAATSFYAGLAQNTWLRKAIGVLKLFG